MDLIPIETSAVSSSVVESSGASKRPSWIERGGTLPLAADRNPFLNWQTRPDVPVNIWRLSDVVLDADRMLLMTEQGVLAETKYSTPPDRIASMCIDRDRLIRLDPGRTYVICGDAWSTNHYHFLSHVLPSIAAAVEFFGCCPLTLLHKPFPPSHARALALLGLDRLDRIEISNDAQYALGDAVFCAYSAGIADFSASDFMAALHDRLGRASRDTSAHGRLIYVCRMDTRHRRMVGEADLVAALPALGFKILDPAALTLDQQIAAFKNARFIMGPHGAGMANVVFCSPGTEIYQLFPRHFCEPSIMVMSLRRDLAYWADAFISDIDRETPDFLRDWRLDVAFALDRARELTRISFRRSFEKTLHGLIGGFRLGA